MYAAASDKNGNLIAVLFSDDGGQRWLKYSTLVKNAPPGKSLLNSTGDTTFGGWIKTINVSPSNPMVVTINWARSFISFSGGKDPWEAVGLVPGATDWNATEAYSKHMHEDGHATVFDIGDRQCRARGELDIVVQLVNRIKYGSAHWTNPASVHEQCSRYGR
jgi:hypothetical protein